jgi:hypothetical protein
MAENSTQLSNTTTSVQRPKRKSWKWKFLLGFILTLALAVYILFFYPYSEGYRDGYVIKFSKKGYVFKTWEGELRINVLSLNDAKPWTFSVVNKSVADKLNTIDQRVYVKLKYKQYIMRAFFRGDTKYFIQEVQILNNQGMPNTMPNALPQGYINK